ncbi:MAG: SLC13 family permease [Chloroflexota bacterium]|nr:SLC13 family permease [Chloroflexota bacterium]MDE2947720.1 SLC13 family permease [Chloroflexota bacterium]
MLTSAELTVIGIIAILLGLIFFTRLRIDIIALLVLLTVALARLVPADAALSGFSSSVVITIIGLLVITSGLEQTGVMQWAARQLQTYGRGSEAKLIALVMAAGAAVSLLMNNVAAAAVLLPAVLQVSRDSGVAASKLMIPLAFGVTVGGMATYFTTANILMSELLTAQGIAGLGMLDFMPVGGMIVAAGLLYMLLIGRRLLPDRASLTQAFNQVDLRDTYDLAERMWLVRVLPGSRLAHQTVGESDINAELGLTVAAVWRGRETITIPKSKQMIYPADKLLIVGREDRLQQLLAWGNELIEGGAKAVAGELPIEPIEITIAPRSDAIGKTLSQMKLNRDAGLLAMALWRDGQSFHTDVRKMPLQVGDAILVVGQTADIENLSQNSNYILPAGEYSAQAIDSRKAPYAVGITAIVLTLSFLNLLPIAIAMLAGAAAMVLTRCLRMQQFYAAVDWRTVFLVAGMLPLSLAITESGLADRVGAFLELSLMNASPLLLFAVIALLTMLVVQVIGGQVTPLLVGPIAIKAALQMGIDPRALALAVAMACSLAFITPISHPVNILMMGPGGYKFSDFSKVGVGMTVVTLLTMLLGLALLWGV